jgi:hypothetical protein
MAEKHFNRPTPFDGNRRKVKVFIQECRSYLQANKKAYETDEDKVSFVLSFMNDKEALKWKQTYYDSIINPEGEYKYPTIVEFFKKVQDDFQPVNEVHEAIHKIAMLKQGKKTAEEILVEFRHLISLAGYSANTPSDQLHLIEKLQRILNPALVRRINLLDTPPTTLIDWANKAVIIDTNYRNAQDIAERFVRDKFGGEGRKKEEVDPNAMQVDAMTNEKRTALMKKGACFICEEPGHLARDCKKKKKKAAKKINATETSSKKPDNSSRSKGKEPSKATPSQNMKKLHALLQSLSKEEKEELFELQNEEKEEEEKEETDDEDF